MIQLRISHEGPLILCFSLMGRLFDHDFIFPWNLACVPFGHDGFFGVG
jgi:hypothetical protein